MPLRPKLHLVLAALLLELSSYRASAAEDGSSVGAAATASALVGLHL